MYNSEQKNEFIKHYTSSVKTATFVRVFFNSLEPYEESRGCDIANLSNEEIGKAFNAIVRLRSRSTDLMIVILKKYIQWCVQNGYATRNEALKIQTNLTPRVREQMVSSPLHLKKVLERYLGDDEYDTIKLIYRVYFWLAFMGFFDDEAITITTEQVDLMKRTITTNDYSCEIYKESFDDIKKACECTSLLFEHPNYTTWKERADGNLILRGFSKEIKIKTLRTYSQRVISKVMEEENLEGGCITYGKVYRSGIFYRAFERERAGYRVDFQNVAQRELQSKVEELKRDIKIAVGVRAREYAGDYEVWKCSFPI